MKRLLFILCNLIIYIASASHHQGSTLTVQYIGSSSLYLVKYTWYRDCAGIPFPTQVTIHYDFNGVAYDSMVLQVAQTSLWYSTLCTIQTTNCASGVGVEKYIYEGVVTLSNDGIYKFHNKSILPYSPIPLPVYVWNYNYVEASIIVNSLFQNSLPEFTSSPEFYFPVSLVSMSNSFASDIDGDSIVYSIIPSVTYDTTLQGPVSYCYVSPNSPYTFGLFMSPAVINTFTGSISFTPTVIALGSIVIKADEYRNGAWMGSIMRQTGAIISTACPTKVDEHNLFDPAIYPNPAFDQIKIAVEKIKRYSIMDVSGRVLQSGIPVDQTIDISLLKKGIYILSFKSNRGISSCKLVKAE